MNIDKALEFVSYLVIVSLGAIVLGRVLSDFFVFGDKNVSENLVLVSFSFLVTCEFLFFPSFFKNYANFGQKFGILVNFLAINVTFLIFSVLPFFKIVNIKSIFFIPVFSFLIFIFLLISKRLTVFYFRKIQDL